MSLLKFLLIINITTLSITTIYAMESIEPISLQRKAGDGDAIAANILLALGKKDEPDAPGGRTALYYAASHGHITIINKLFNNNVNPNIRFEKNGYTALLVATRREQLEAIKKLLDYKPTKVDAVSKDGENIFHIAVDREPSAGPDMIAMLQTVKDDNAKKLTELVNKPDNNGITPLEKALRKGYPRTARALSTFPGINISDAERHELENLLKKFPQEEEEL